MPVAIPRLNFITPKVHPHLHWVLLLFVMGLGGMVFSGCDGLKPSPQDTTLSAFPQWVQGIFQLPLGASQGFIAVKLNSSTNPVVSPSGSTSILPFPGLSMLTQLIAYAQEPNTPLEPFAYWLMLQTPTTTKPTEGGMVERNPEPSTTKGQGVWILSLKESVDSANTATFAKSLGFMPQTQASNRQLFKTNTSELWQQPAHQIWMAKYPESETHRLLFASSEDALLQATNQLKQVSGAKGRLLPEAKLKLVHGLETLYGSTTVPATSEITNASLLMGMPSNSSHWKRFDAGKKIKSFKLPWQKTDATALKHSWTLLAATRKLSSSVKREQCHLDFVTPLYVTAEERKMSEAQWLDFIFGTPNTKALVVKTPVAISLSHVNEAITAAIEEDAFSQWKQPLSMIKPALTLMQMDFNRDVLGLLAGETWMATPTEKEAWLILQKTPVKQTSMNKWIQHLSGKSWLSKILFDGKLQQNPILESKPLADGAGTFWEIHLPRTSKNLLVSNLPPMGLVESENAFVIAPVKELTQKGVLKTLNQLIQPKVLPQLGYEPLVGVQFDATQPNSAWLLKHLNKLVFQLANRNNPSSTPNSSINLDAGSINLSAGYQPSRGSVRGQFDLDMTTK
jgi:hypothetical protein